MKETISSQNGIYFGRQGAVDPGRNPTGVSIEDWEKLNRKARSMIRLCLLDSLLLNVFGEDCKKAMGKVRELISV